VIEPIDKEPQDEISFSFTAASKKKGVKLIMKIVVMHLGDRYKVSKE
jgi:hypothetical protein